MLLLLRCVLVYFEFYRIMHFLGLGGLESVSTGVAGGIGHVEGKDRVVIRDMPPGHLIFLACMHTRTNSRWQVASGRWHEVA